MEKRARATHDKGEVSVFSFGAARLPHVRMRPQQQQQQQQQSLIAASSRPLTAHIAQRAGNLFAPARSQPSVTLADRERVVDRAGDVKNLV